MEQALCLAQAVRCLLLIGRFVSAEGRRGGRLSSFTFRWSAKTNAEEGFPNTLTSGCGVGSEGKRKEALEISCLRSARELLGIKNLGWLSKIG